MLTKHSRLAQASSVTCRSRASAVCVRATLSQEPVGAQVQKWLATPFDVAAFGPRAGLGALVSLPERLQSLQYDMERVVELIQDPRPIEEKQAVVMKEFEETVVQFLEKGVVLETDILTNVKSVLPAEAASIINDIVPPAPNSVKDEPFSSGTYYEEYQTPAPIVTYQQVDVLPNQVASEMTEIKNAVTGLKLALDAVRINTDVSATLMLRRTLREARDQLSRRLTEVSPVTAMDTSISAATREASILLEEVDAQFFT